MLARFRQDVAALNPKVVVILGGTNDIAAGISVNQIEDNLATMGDLAKAHGIKPIFASILPVSDYHKDADPHYEMTLNRPPATIQSINTLDAKLLPESGVRVHGLLRRPWWIQRAGCSRICRMTGCIQTPRVIA